MLGGSLRTELGSAFYCKSLFRGQMTPSCVLAAGSRSQPVRESRCRHSATILPAYRQPPYTSPTSADPWCHAAERGPIHARQRHVAPHVLHLAPSTQCPRPRRRTFARFVGTSDGTRGRGLNWSWLLRCTAVHRTRCARLNRCFVWRRRTRTASTRRGTQGLLSYRLTSPRKRGHAKRRKKPTPRNCQISARANRVRWN
jgi:hypothetical protein